MEFQGVVRDKFIYKHSLGSSNAVTNQWNEMSVMDTTNYFNLRLKFTLPLSTPRFKLLNCNYFTIKEDSLMDITKTTLSNKVSIGETICCHCKFFIRKGTLWQSKSARRWWYKWFFRAQTQTATRWRRFMGNRTKQWWLIGLCWDCWGRGRVCQ